MLQSLLCPKTEAFSLQFLLSPREHHLFFLTPNILQAGYRKARLKRMVLLLPMSLLKMQLHNTARSVLAGWFSSSGAQISRDDVDHTPPRCGCSLWPVNISFLKKMLSAIQVDCVSGSLAKLLNLFEYTLCFLSLSPTARTKVPLCRLHCLSLAHLPVGEWEVFQMGCVCSRCGSTLVHLVPLRDNETTMYLFRLF